MTKAAIPVSYREQDFDVLKAFLKQFGYGHFRNTLYRVTAMNMKRGAQIEFDMISPRSQTETSEWRIRSILISVRKAVTKYDGEVKAEYQPHICFKRNNKPSDDENDVWVVSQNPMVFSGKWPQVVNTVTEILKTCDGEIVEKTKFEGILQNIILDDLKRKLKAAGYADVKFVAKAKKAENRSVIVLSAPKVYSSITLGLKSGEFVVTFGQSSGSRCKVIPIPFFEDPKFDPALFFDGKKTTPCEKPCKPSSLTRKPLAVGWL